MLPVPASVTSGRLPGRSKPPHYLLGPTAGHSLPPSAKHRSPCITRERPLQGNTSPRVRRWCKQCRHNTGDGDGASWCRRGAGRWSTVGCRRSWAPGRWFLVSRPYRLSWTATETAGQEPALYTSSLLWSTPTHAVKMLRSHTTIANAIALVLTIVDNHTATKLHIQTKNLTI